MWNRPDISAIRDRAALASTTNTNQLTALPFQPPALEDLEAPRRQTSLDGEAIKIIIHDVDSGPFFAAKRRVTLRKDPTDKAHRSKLIYFFFKSIYENFVQRKHDLSGMNKFYAIIFVFALFILNSKAYAER